MGGRRYKVFAQRRSPTRYGSLEPYGITLVLLGDWRKPVRPVLRETVMETILVIHASQFLDRENKCALSRRRERTGKPTCGSLPGVHCLSWKRQFAGNVSGMSKFKMFALS